MCTTLKGQRLPDLEHGHDLENVPYGQVAACQIYNQKCVIKSDDRYQIPHVIRTMGHPYRLQTESSQASSEWQEAFLNL